MTTNMFALILAITTIITGIFWCLERFKLSSFYNRLKQRKIIDQEKINSIKEITNNSSIAVTINHNPIWIETCASIFPVLLLVFIVRSFIFEPFQIPSGSMMPTLLVGDFILVVKFAYGIKDPITQTTLIKIGHPKRGDVVVFKFPLNPKLNYIKRIIGLPGDRVIYNPLNKQLTVQPNCTNSQNCTETIPIIYSEIMLSNFEKTFDLNEKMEDKTDFLQTLSNQAKDDIIRLVQCKESLGSVVHDILILPGKYDQSENYYQQKGFSLGQWIIPDGEYFVMGDNRDDSADSRFWGFVPEKNLVGKAVAIWISFEKREGQWPTGIRLSRIGSIR